MHQHATSMPPGWNWCNPLRIESPDSPWQCHGFHASSHTLRIDECSPLKRLAYLTTMYVKANLRVLHLICTFSIQRLVLEDLLDAHDVDDLTSAASTLSHQIKTMSRIYKEQRAYFDQMLTTFDDAGERAAFKFSLCRRQREQRSVVVYDVHVCVCARVGACIIYAQCVCVCWGC